MTDMCSSQHCSGVSTQINQTCKANNWPVNHLVLVCDPNTGKCCNCTCSCLAYNTPVAVSSSDNAAIQSFKINDPVLARDEGKWVEKSVKFSDGTGPNSVQPEMCYITYKLDGELKVIVVTLDHTFLTEKNKLIRARQLKKGEKVQAADGKMTEIIEYNVKSYVGGVWNIATSHDTPTSLDGHLLNTQGLISGDYAVQLFYEELSKKGFAVSDVEMPEFNSHQYQEALSEDTAQLAFKAAAPAVDVEHFLSAVSNPLHASHGASKKSGASGGVYLHVDHTHVLSVPARVQPQGYLTSEQAASIRRNDTKVDKNVMTRTQWLLTIMHAFYPNINFIVDYPNRNSNAFSFYLGDEPTVLLQGGLLHAKQVGWEATAVITAYCVARFTDDTVGSDGMNCKPEADNDVPGILTNVFYPLYPNTIFPGVDQIEALFNVIPDKNDNPVKGCHGVTLDCRLEIYRNAMQYLPLPPCAGGEENYLMVTGAQVDSAQEVTVSFDAPLNAEDAEKTANYVLDPELTVTKAKLIAPDNNQVTLTADFKAKTAYKVTVQNVRSVTGLELDPKANSATFTTA